MTQKVQTVYETKMYSKVRPSREEMKTDEVWKKIKFLRGNLARAAGRPRPQVITVSLDYLYSVGEKQQWRDPFTNEAMEFDRGGDWGITNNNGTGASNPLSCSIDRINSSKGYVNGNIQLVTARTNLAKGNMDNKEFKQFCEKVCQNKQ